MTNDVDNQWTFYAKYLVEFDELFDLEHRETGEVMFSESKIKDIVEWYNNNIVTISIITGTQQPQVIYRFPVQTHTFLHIYSIAYFVKIRIKCIQQMYPNLSK